jgi:hypothetical protein
MDPLSIVVSTFALAGVCARITDLLKEFKDGLHNVDEDLDTLLSEVTRLEDILRLTDNGFQGEGFETRDVSKTSRFINLKETARSTITDCQSVLERIESLIIQVIGDKKPPFTRLDSLRKHLRRNAKEDEFNNLRTLLKNRQVVLQTALIALGL